VIYKSPVWAVLKRKPNTETANQLLVLLSVFFGMFPGRIDGQAMKDFIENNELRSDKTKFQFPSRGFHIVADKVGEADYFLDCLKHADFRTNRQFGYHFSAFVSAARSTTFALQAVMSGYPGFKEWYEPRQKKLKENPLARFFHDLRNHLLHVGSLPIMHSGFSQNRKIISFQYFVPIKEIRLLLLLRLICYN